jgi:hypothetical protein
VVLELGFSGIMGDEFKGFKSGFLVGLFVGLEAIKHLLCFAHKFQVVPIFYGLGFIMTTLNQSTHAHRHTFKKLLFYDNIQRFHFQQPCTLLQLHQKFLVHFHLSFFLMVNKNPQACMSQP